MLLPFAPTAATSSQGLKPRRRSSASRLDAFRRNDPQSHPELSLRPDDHGPDAEVDRGLCALSVTLGPPGGNHTIALRRHGTVWAWGWNDSGQVGNGATEKRLTPVQVRASERNARPGKKNGRRRSLPGQRRVLPAGARGNPYPPPLARPGASGEVQILKSTDPDRVANRTGAGPGLLADTRTF